MRFTLSTRASSVLNEKNPKKRTGKLTDSGVDSAAEEQRTKVGPLSLSWFHGFVRLGVGHTDLHDFVIPQEQVNVLSDLASIAIALRQVENGIPEMSVHFVRFNLFA